MSSLFNRISLSEKNSYYLLKIGKIQLFFLISFEVNVKSENRKDCFILISGVIFPQILKIYQDIFKKNYLMIFLIEMYKTVGFSLFHSCFSFSILLD